MCHLCITCLWVQDAVERGWLRESRSRHGHINTLAVLATAAEIASGMAVLHQAGIIHGDLSAFNIMLSRWACATPQPTF